MTLMELEYGKRNIQRHRITERRGAGSDEPCAPTILRYGIGILATIVMVLLIGSTLFSYPETVQVEVTLMTESPPIYLKSPQTGRIEKLYVKNGLQVKKGDILAIMENLADTEDMLRLR